MFALETEMQNYATPYLSIYYKYTGTHIDTWVGIIFHCYSVAQSCLTLCDLVDCSTPGFTVLHYLLDWVGDAIYYMYI